MRIALRRRCWHWRPPRSARLDGPGDPGLRLVPRLLREDRRRGRRWWPSTTRRPGRRTGVRWGGTGTPITLSDPAAAVGVVRRAWRSTPTRHRATAATATWRLGLGVGAARRRRRRGRGRRRRAVLVVMPGGEGEDTLARPPGDRFDGGPGADRIDGGRARLAGGFLSFRGRRAGVSVDLARGRTSDGDVIAASRGVRRPRARPLRGGPAARCCTAARAPTCCGPRRQGRAGRRRRARSPLRGAGADHLSGGAGGDRLSGGAGADELVGDRGPDRLSGGPGADEMIGNAGRDALFGGPGADQLSGGRGADRLAGGDGPDRLECVSGSDKARCDAKDHVQACENLRERGYTSSTLIKRSHTAAPRTA